MPRSPFVSAAARTVTACMLLPLLGAAAACSSSEPAGEQDARATGEQEVVRVAAAASMREALEEIVAIFHERHAGAGWRVERVYTASGAAYQQLRSGAPFHLFVSADALHPRALEERSLVEPGSRRVYACGALALWRRGTTVETGGDVTAEGSRMAIAALANTDVRRVAIPNPETAPYGRAAIEALRAAEVEAAVRPKLVTGQDAAQAAQIALAGADAAILPRSAMAAPAFTARGRWTRIDPRLHGPLAHSTVLIRRGDTAPPAAARALHTLLLSGAAADPLRRHGYALPRKSRTDTERPRAGGDSAGGDGAGEDSVGDESACGGAFAVGDASHEPREGAR